MAAKQGCLAGGQVPRAQLDPDRDAARCPGQSGEVSRTVSVGRRSSAWTARASACLAAAPPR